MWMKWNHKFAHGPGETEWLEIHPKEDVRDLIEELSQEYSYANLYRGISYELLETAPKEIIIEQLKKAQQSFVNLQFRIANLEAQLESK